MKMNVSAVVLARLQIWPWHTIYAPGLSRSCVKTAAGKDAKDSYLDAVESETARSGTANMEGPSS